MEHPDSNDTADETIADSGSDLSTDANTAANMSDSANVNDSESPPTRPSAIERQMAASRRGRDSQTYREVADHVIGRYVYDYNTTRRRHRRFVSWRFLLLVLVVAVGLGLLFIDLNRPLQKTADALPPATNVSPVTDSSSATNASPPNVSQTPENAVQTPTDTSQAPPNTAQTTEATDTAQNSTPASIIPLADISLRTQPDVLEQQVKIYQSQLASDPNNAAAKTALSQLQERSLSELQTIVLDGDDAAAVKLLEIISRLFPEAADSARYKYAAARADRIKRQTHDESPTQSIAAKTAAPEPATKSAAVPHATTSTKTALPRNDSSSAGAAKSTENAQSSKPEIRTVSITPGTLVKDRFVPGNGGNAFMVEIAYRNFNRAFVGKAEATLVTLLGAPGDSMVLAEVPVVISADRGTKSFVMETNSAQGYVGGKLQLNFILNDEFLASRTVRLSMSGQ